MGCEPLPDIGAETPLNRIGSEAFLLCYSIYDDPCYSRKSDHSYGRDPVFHDFSRTKVYSTKDKSHDYLFYIY